MGKIRMAADGLRAFADLVEEYDAISYKDPDYRELADDIVRRVVAIRRAFVDDYVDYIVDHLKGLRGDPETFFLGSLDSIVDEEISKKYFGKGYPGIITRFNALAPRGKGLRIKTIYKRALTKAYGSEVADRMLKSKRRGSDVVMASELVRLAEVLTAGAGRRKKNYVVADKVVDALSKVPGVESVGASDGFNDETMFAITLDLEVTKEDWPSRSAGGMVPAEFAIQLRQLAGIVKSVLRRLGTQVIVEDDMGREREATVTPVRDGRMFFPKRKSWKDEYGETHGVYEDNRVSFDVFMSWDWGKEVRGSMADDGRSRIAEVNFQDAQRAGMKVVRSLGEPASNRRQVLKQIADGIAENDTVMAFLLQRIDGSGKIDYHAIVDVMGGPLMAWREDWEIDDPDGPFDELSGDPDLQRMIEGHLRKFMKRSDIRPEVGKDYSTAKIKARSLLEEVGKLDSGRSTDERKALGLLGEIEEILR